MSHMNWSWSDPNAYRTQPEKKAEIEHVAKHSDIAHNAEERGATRAIIMSTEHRSAPGGDQRNHVTVDFKRANGSHVTRKHIVTSPASV